MRVEELFFTRGYSANVSEDGQLLYVGRAGGLWIYDIKRKKLIRIVKTVKAPRRFRICGDLLAYSNMLTVKIIDLKSERIIKTLRSGSGIGERFTNELLFINDYQLCFLPDTHTSLKLYDISTDKTYTIWSAPTDIRPWSEIRICHVTCCDEKIYLIINHVKSNKQHVSNIEILSNDICSVCKPQWRFECRIEVDNDAETYSSRFASSDGKTVYIPYVNNDPNLSRIDKYDLDGNLCSTLKIPLKSLISGFDSCDEYFSINTLATRWTIDADTMSIVDEAIGFGQIIHMCEHKDYFSVSYGADFSLFHVIRD